MDRLLQSWIWSIAMIRKLKSGKYRLYSKKKDPKTGKRKNLGTFNTREEAEKHEKEVQYFKRRWQAKHISAQETGGTSRCLHFHRKMHVMDIQYSYLGYSLIFILVWLIFYIQRPDLRRRMLIFSLIIMPLGPLSEFWFLKDY